MIVRVRNGGTRKNAGLSGWLDRKRLEGSLDADSRANKKFRREKKKKAWCRGFVKLPRPTPSVLTKPGPKPIPTAPADENEHQA